MRFFSLLMFILIVTCPLAFAQSRDAKSGRLNAFICEPLPPAPVLDVEMLDDAPRYQQLKDKFASVLRKNGIDVRAGAPLVLTIDLKTLRDSQASDKHDLGELRLGKDGGVSLRGNLWSNSADSVLGGRKKSSPGYDTTYLAITASLNRRDDGGCVWQGELVHDLKGDDPDRSAYGFMAPLADAIGQSIWNKSVVMSD